MEGKGGGARRDVSVADDGGDADTQYSQGEEEEEDEDDDEATEAGKRARNQKWKKKWKKKAKARKEQQEKERVLAEVWKEDADFDQALLEGLLALPCCCCVV